MVAQSTTRLMSPFKGYTSAELLHEGAETAVYRARAEGTGAPLILKVTKSEYPTARELARLRREFSLLRDLDLTQIPKAYALEEHGHGLALVMSDLGHPTLREIMDAQRLPIEAALRVALSLSDVLAEVHRLRVVHKDVTPRNIIVDLPAQQAYLIDFGISTRLAEELQSAAAPSALEGTLAYIAPEQTGRMSRAVDLRADLYALGAVLYEMLTGAVPFEAQEPAELIHCHLARLPLPAHERAPSVPEPLSAIVMTLLAKAPEERYQSDAGLKADLTTCLTQWVAAKRIEPFPLRRRDKATEIRRSPRLYGRERDIEALLQAFNRASLRGPSLALVSGYSGIGKSALVSEIHRLTAHRSGYFVSGKFEQMAQDAPLAPIVQALRELILQVLTEPPEALSRRRGELLDALGENGRLITDLIPELELIIGPQPSVPELSPDLAKNRFELTLQNFLDVFAAPERPLVLFLDDLQWIDPASLKLLRLLLVDAYSQNVLLIGAYRSSEVEPGHPLLSALADLSRAGVHATEIELCPLDLETVVRLVADTLTSRPEEVSDLAELVHEKTLGNPFFAHQFMVALSEKGLLRFDAAEGAWRWDIAQIRAAAVTDNVVDLMVAKLRELAPATQRALMLASCIGFHFDLRSLSTIGQAAPAAMAGALWDALREGLVLPLDADYRLLEGASPGVDAADLAAVSGDINVRYRFLHDRVLHAAYSLVDPTHKQELHLSIGRLLWQLRGSSPRDEDLLEIVRHMNLGAKRITDPATRVELARLNLRAGRRAKAATAYSAGAGYCSAGIELLSDSDWESEYDLCFALYVEDAECEYLDGNAPRAKALFDVALPRARTDIERAAICKMRVRILCSITEYAEALKAGCEGLALLGIPISMEDLESQAVFAAELDQVKVNLRGRRIEDLIDAPELEDPRIRGAMEILDAMAASAFYTSPNAYGLVGFKGTNLALSHGHTDVCAFSYVNSAYAFTLFLGRVEEGLAFGRLAIALTKRFPNAMQLCKVNLCYGCFYPLAGPLRGATEYFAATVQAGLGSGDFPFLGSGCFLTTVVRIVAGDQLEDVLEQAKSYLAIVRRTKEILMVATMTFVQQATAALLGQTQGRTSLSDDSFDEASYVGRLNDREHSFALFHYHYVKTQLHYLHGEHEQALSALFEAEKRAMSAGGNPAAKTLSFFACLVILGQRETGSPEEAARRAEILERNRKELDFLAAASPEGFQHMKTLVDAEAARAAGELERAGRLYEQAIELSHAAKAPNIEAMACELSGKLFIGAGMQRAAGAFMKDAYRAYLHWGALSKAATLEAEYAQKLPSLRRESTRTKTTKTSTRSRSGELTNTSSTILSQTTVGSLRDAALVLRAAQAIASEIDLPKVIDRLASLVLENAGAQRGALVLSRDGDPRVSAVFGEALTAVDEEEGRPLSASDDVAQSVIRYVARTQDSVVLDDTTAASRFAEDPYIQGGAPKSILCLPLLYQGRLIGVLYLENRATSGVFNAARVELLALLSSQAAIAIENARLISSVRAATTEVKRVNEGLEEQVAKRTRELDLANKDLSAAKTRLEHELVQREEIERERMELKEQMIDAQRARLAEMSTPVIPITDEIIVMPLIGSVDRERATQVLQAALEGAQRHRARVLILDVTGIRHIDSNVAGTLLGVATALRLLGAETVVTGIAPVIAGSLVGLGIDLTSFKTMGTLQGGMDYAMRRVQRGVRALRAAR
jgi:predicted ATPase/GAF domain-containing protein/anti-anti-sigma regulatory factor/tRNA A-37 threonylcarbamoyl transferase component Bud32